VVGVTDPYGRNLGSLDGGQPRIYSINSHGELMTGGTPVKKLGWGGINPGHNNTACCVGLALQRICKIEDTLCRACSTHREQYEGIYSLFRKPEVKGPLSRLLPKLGTTTKWISKYI
jgi:hypothetical protein